MKCGLQPLYSVPDYFSFQAQFSVLSFRSRGGQRPPHNNQITYSTQQSEYVPRWDSVPLTRPTVYRGPHYYEQWQTVPLHGSSQL